MAAMRAALVAASVLALAGVLLFAGIICGHTYSLALSHVWQYPFHPNADSSGITGMIRATAGFRAAARRNLRRELVLTAYYDAVVRGVEPFRSCRCISPYLSASLSAS